jgi:hypothetical protein
MSPSTPGRAGRPADGPDAEGDARDHGATFDATSEVITKIQGKAEGHSFSFVTSGTTFTTTETCPMAGSVRLFHYSATPSSLVLYSRDDVNGGTVVHTYVR